MYILTKYQFDALRVATELVDLPRIADVMQSIVTLNEQLATAEVSR